jgi:hypothetical protein
MVCRSGFRHPAGERSPDSGIEIGKEQDMEKWKCIICWYIYDPSVGDPENGVEPGTAFE